MRILEDIKTTPEYKLGVIDGKTQTIQEIKRIMHQVNAGVSTEEKDAELYAFKEVLKAMLDESYQQGIHDGSW